MANSTLKKVGIGIGGAVLAIGVIALGVKIGNVGVSKTMDDLKETIKEKLEKKDDTSTPNPEEPKTSTQAVKIEFVDFVA